MVITDELRLENLAAKLVIELEKAKITISRTVVVNENFTQQEINNALEGLRNYGRGNLVSFLMFRLRFVDYPESRL